MTSSRPREPARPRPVVGDRAPTGGPSGGVAAILRARGVEPRDLALYRRALRHRSATGLATTTDDAADLHANERLEFLGDAVLDLIASEELYRRLPDEAEGALTRRRAAFVRTEQLAAWAAELGLFDLMEVAPSERASPSGRERILAGAYEALVGAIYLDRGLRAARRFVHDQLVRDFELIMSESASANPKGRLQEMT